MMDVSAQDKFKQTYTGVYVSVISGSRCRQPFVIPFAFVLACLEEAAGLGVCVCVDCGVLREGTSSCIACFFPFVTQQDLVYGYRSRW